MSSPTEQQNFIERLADRIDNLSRPLRIALNMLISLVVMGLLGVPIVFITAGGQVNTIEEGEVLYGPTIAIAIVWLIVYGFGWNALVGFDWDEEQEWRAGASAAYTVLLGAFATVLLFFACVYGLLFALVL